MAKAVREFKRERLLQLNLARLEDAHPLDISDMKVNVTDFIRIFSRVWFFWSTPTDRITAWRKVGICQNFLAAFEIDRSNFIVQDNEKHTSTAPPSVTEFKGSPLGVRKGSSEYYKRKIEAYKNLASAWETYETSPIEQGILNPEILPSLPPKANKGRLSDNNGSFEFNDILGRKRAKHAEQQAAREHSEFAALQRDLAREERDSSAAAAVAAKAQAALGLQAAWEKCGGGCTCPLLFVNMARVPCPVYKMKQCRICGEIKKSKCAKAACKRQLATET
ncbi:hypothetical protein CYMTET_13278 [Cymbomonas tetramitiformis]|uniref:Uncharacterized protein n=1 Tax=Cymbomonas tetramitiformis TaxID=36881 RepID=A0AAE0LBM4_9CHLO|nr:hypothetical protein CYMTET_13278 [Cymbomonas tetramitiformis]